MLFSKNKKFLRNEFISASFFSAISAAIKIFTSFVLSKIIAIYLGPNGLGLLGQLTSFVAIVLVFSGGTINMGTTKYIAQYNSEKEEESVEALISTALRIVIISGLFVGILLILASGFLSKKILYSDDYQIVFVLFGITIVFYGLNNLLGAVVNGFKEFKKFNILGIIGSILSLVISFLFILSLNTLGALISLVVNQSLIFFVSIFLLRKEKWLNVGLFHRKFDFKYGKNLFKYAVLAIFSSALTPATQLIVRNEIIETLGINFAGYWELVTRISTAALLFFSLSISTYYLPRMSELKTELEFKKEIINAYKIVIPVALISFSAIFFARYYVIRLLATKEFFQASQLFLFQFIGDFFKICAWILGFQMVARAKIKLSIFTETFYNSSLIVFSFIFINKIGFIGISYAYALNYFIYFLLLVFIFRKTFLIKT